MEKEFRLSMKAKRRIVRFLHIPIVHRTIKFLKRLVIPGFQKVPFWEVMRFFIESVVNGILFQRAAALTYYIFTTAIPLLMALVALISFMGENVKTVLLGFLETVVPTYLWGGVSQIVNNLILRQDGALVWLSLFLGIYLSFLSMHSILNTLNITYFSVSKRSFVKQLRVSFTMVLIFMITIVVACAIFMGIAHLLHLIDSHFIESTTFYTIALNSAKWLLMFILFYLFLSALFYFTPYKKQDFRFFSAGSMFSTILSIILIFGVSAYFSNFSTYNLVYGSIGGILIILFWIYWTSVIILIGFDLNVSITHALKKFKDRESEIKITSSVIDS